MNNKIEFKVLLLGVFLLLVTSLVIVETYALFETNGVANKNMELGKWKILLNQNDISQTRTITLNDFQYTNGEHTDNNYFAPGTTAYFDIVMDAHLSDVSVIYNLSINNSQIVGHPNIHLTFENMDTNQVIQDNEIEGIIGLNDTNRIVTLRVSLIWENTLQYDELDTELIGEELEFVITANFKQYIGE